MAALIGLQKVLQETEIGKQRRAVKAAGLSFVLDRACFQKFLKVTSNTSLESEVTKLTKKNTALKNKTCEQHTTIRRLQKELRNAEMKKAEAECAGAFQDRSLMTMAQELEDQQAYITQLEKQIEKK